MSGRRARAGSAERRGGGTGGPGAGDEGCGADEGGCHTGPMKQEVVRQLGLIYGGLTLMGLYMVQPFLTAPSLDASAKVSIVAFAVAIPLLAALVMVNRQEAFRGRLTPSVMVTVARAVAQGAAFVGPSRVLAYHVIAGVTFLAAGLVAVGIHSAGYIRLEGTKEPTSEDRGPRLG